MNHIALFGGSFDPIHLGHTAILDTVCSQMALDHVFVLPCQQSPHKAKAPLASDQHRLNMCRLACEHLKDVTVSDHELTRTTSPSFSWMTVEHFQSLHPQAQLYWILGTDQWDALERWDRFEYLATYLHFLVLERQAPIPKKQSVSHTALKFDYQISSTKIREQLSNGKAPTELAPAVSQYIQENHLYRPRH